ncbi:DNA glycosylase AlkZ-like family protein [Streptacidiphilus fuscans]|uniref:Winged helix DNA-binding domain-containing protein n=1 Tax=Streptacidiphilus fuscans TaxID=2789292 RepID=A0A931FGZ9_9ACTN|nr:crosslink repair DNA glycosylase YcaQ family protein [Streptacidiphilus fuscans]MBF9070129.1 winged helix DNA-binding domain-containing protein [Streptacidiphilus fuscans]
MTAPELDPARLRAWWAHRQGLDGSLSGADPATVLTRTGWARSVGGAAPYLGLFARAGLSREAVDAAVAALEIHELPSARGCTYVLPAADFALGLTLGAGAPEGELAAARKHLGVTDAEIDALRAAVLAALDSAQAPLDPAAIKDAVGDAVRNLGEAGKKRGTATTLPLALGLLQASGEIRRSPVNGRLDQQRYGYVRWQAGPVDVADADVELARRYFAWAAPASLAHFRWFSGFTAARAKAAIAPLGLTPVAAAEGAELLLPPGLAEEFAAYRRPEKPHYALLAGIDGIHLLHRDLARLIDPADTERPVPGAKAGRVFGSDADPQCHIVVDRGRIVGFWEYDTERSELVHQLFVPLDAALDDALTSTEAFVRDQLGDARGFSLDSPKSRAPKIAAMREAAGNG